MSNDNEFSHYKKIFFPLFWKKRNYYLLDGFNRKSAEWLAFGNATHDALLQTKTIEGNSKFVLKMRKYLQDNKLAIIE